MAQVSPQTPQEFIQNAFSPMVAVMASSPVDAAVQKNNLNFVELLQPFCRVTCEGYVKDPSGTMCVVRNLTLNISNVNTRPPQPTLARRFLNESVSTTYQDKTINQQIGKYKIDIPESTPWFSAWRETFFSVQFPSEHEFTRHYVACVMVVGAWEAPSPVESLSRMVQQLTQMQTQAPPRLPKWFNTQVLRCYVLVHDAQQISLEKSEKCYESIKNIYGAGNCFFLSINSANPQDPQAGTALPDPWTRYLLRRQDNTEGDKDSLPRTPYDISGVAGMPSELAEALEGAGGASEGARTPPCEAASEAAEHPLSPSQNTPPSTPYFTQGDALSTSTEDGGLLNPSSVSWQPNSANGAPGVLHGALLTQQDRDNVAALVRELTVKALLPYVERQIYQITDIVANKKGVGRSLFSATKRWFGTNKPGTTPVNSVIYTGSCPELQLRRLGDLWFMLGQWSPAYQAYHAAKREFSADGAWLFYAGALEMAALSAFMGGEATRKTHDYMEEAILTYLNACRMPQYAVRATLLSVQCLLASGRDGEACRQLLRMTSEECDLRSALLLEQTALSCLRSKPRKYAFHMVLAGHRYCKANQRSHSLRCYRHAYQIYCGGGWRLATDHIEFAVGRMAGTMKQWEDAAMALASLLAPSSLQPEAQQAAFLREYLHVHQQWISHTADTTCLIPVLPVPLLRSNLTCVQAGTRCLQTSSPVNSSSSSSTPSVPPPPWAKLEEMLITTAKTTPPMLFKPTLSVFGESTDNTSNPVVPQGEPVEVTVYLGNPLKVVVTITDLQLLWQYSSLDQTQASSAPFSNEDCVAAGREYDKSVVITQKLATLTLTPENDTMAVLSLTPLHPGTLTLIGIAYKLKHTSQENESSTDVSVLGKQVFSIRGPKLKNAKDVPGETQYGADKRLEITVVPPAPCLQVAYTDVSPVLLSGELQRIKVEFTNVGRVPLKSLYMAASHPQYLCLDTEQNKPFAALLEERYLPAPVIQDERQQRMDREKRVRLRHCTLVVPHLDAGARHTVALWLRAPPRSGSHTLHTLFYYEHGQITAQGQLPKHRLYRHTMTVNVQDSVAISAIAKRAMCPNSTKTQYEEALNMAVEVKNSNQLHHGILTSIETQQVSLLSQNWILQDCVATEQEPSLLQSQETLHIILRARRDFSTRKIDEILATDLKLNKNINIVSIKDAPYSNFITDYTSNFDEYDSYSEMFNSSDKSDVKSTLVVRWRADITENGGFTRFAIGQHHLQLDKLNTNVFSLLNDSLNAKDLPLKLFSGETVQGSAAESSGDEDRLVSYTLEHVPEYKHDFSKQSICLVPVNIHLVNCSNQQVEAVINTSKGAGGMGWVGCGVSSIKLSALSGGRLQLLAASARPGAYAPGDSLRVACGDTLQAKPAPSTLLVMQEA